MWKSVREEFLATLFICFALAPTPPVARAQSTWRNSIDVYVLFSAINGTVGIGPVESELDLSFSDLIKNLDGGFLSSYRGENDQLAFGADMIYLKLKTDGTSSSGLTTVGMMMTQLIAELHGMVRLTKNFEVYAGIRYWYIDTDLSIDVDINPDDPDDPTTGSLTESWVDPIIGVRGVLPLSTKIRLIGRGDIGGFDIGSDFAWHLSLHGQWRLGKLVSAISGFRVIDVKYDSGSGSDFFLMDVTVQGPMAGVTFHL